MVLGEAIFEDFYLIKDNPAEEVIELDLPKSSLNDCCFTLPVLAKTTGGDKYSNDKSSAIFFLNNGITSGVLKLEKFVSGLWAEVEDLDDNTFGELLAFGDATNGKGENLIGFIIDWQTVLNDIDLGPGSYRIKTEETTVLGSTVNRYSIEWCLNEYTQYRAEKSVRFEWFNTGIIGDRKKDSITRDFGSLNWFNQARFPDSYFGRPSTETERSFTQYTNSRQIWTEDKQIEQYLFRSGRIPNFIYRFIKTDILLSNELFVTNYYSNKDSEHIDRKIIPSGDITPEWSDFSAQARVELVFKQFYQNDKHERC